MAKQPATESNVSSELWAEALAVYEADKHHEDQARGTTKRHQIAYESQGINPTMVRRLYKETQLSETERLELYATEQVARRALDLWNAETPEEFNRVMERAAATAPATGEGADKLAGVRSYNDGFNGARHGKQTQTDNPHVAGSALFVQWRAGCGDGLDYNAQIEAGTVPREAPAMEEAPTGTILDRDEAAYRAPQKAKGRPRKKAAASEDVPAVTNEELDQALSADSMFSEMPSVPGLPH